MRGLQVWLRRWVILVHRWLGIGLGLLFSMWFVSGIGMIWARGMPSLTSTLRLERLTAIDFSRVRLTPAEAMARSGVARGGRLTLLTVLERPAYRVAAGREGPVTVFADSGEMLDEIGDAEALAVAARFARVPASSLRPLGVLDRADQWSIAQRRQLPLHKFAVDDPQGTELYVSDANAEVVLMTTRGGRTLAWVAAIPHWMYFRALRVNDRLWTRVVLWTSGLGIAAASLGLILALLQMRTKYVGWMRWHYVTGAIFGLFALTWVFSGWLSMDPIDWTEEGSGARIPQALSGGAADLSAFPAFDAAKWTEALDGRAAKEVEFRNVQGSPFLLVRVVDRHPLLMAADTLQIRLEPFSRRSIVDRLAMGNPNVPIASEELLADYDSYYYDRDREEPLPVIRIKFADAARSWFYVDPMMGQVVARFTRGERVERWLYHGLHSLDFSFWYYNTPLWEAGMVVLLGGGSILSVVGMVIGLKRLRRSVGF